MTSWPQESPGDDPLVRTVEEIREDEGEPLYSIQLGRDFATRIWAKQSELEAARNGIRCW